MFGSCRICYRPTDRWQDFCNECATRDVSPRLRVIRGGKSKWERPGRKTSDKRWLTPVPPPPPRPPEV